MRNKTVNIHEFVNEYNAYLEKQAGVVDALRKGAVKVKEIAYGVGKKVGLVNAGSGYGFTRNINGVKANIMNKGALDRLRGNQIIRMNGLTTTAPKPLAAGFKGKKVVPSASEATAKEAITEPKFMSNNALKRFKARAIVRKSGLHMGGITPLSKGVSGKPVTPTKVEVPKMTFFNFPQDNPLLNPSLGEGMVNRMGEFKGIGLTPGEQALLWIKQNPKYTAGGVGAVGLGGYMLHGGNDKVVVVNNDGRRGRQ